MPENSTLVSIRLPDELRREMDEFARMTRRSRSFIIKETVSAFLPENKAYRAAMDEALADADRSVLVSGEAVDGWIAS